MTAIGPRHAGSGEESEPLAAGKSSKDVEAHDGAMAFAADVAGDVRARKDCSP
jgi:hypothetical protein